MTCISAVFTTRDVRSEGERHRHKHSRNGGGDHASKQQHRIVHGKGADHIAGKKYKQQYDQRMESLEFRTDRGANRCERRIHEREDSHKITHHGHGTVEIGGNVGKYAHDDEFAGTEQKTLKDQNGHGKREQAVRCHIRISPSM